MSEGGGEGGGNGSGERIKEGIGVLNIFFSMKV